MEYQVRTFVNHKRKLAFVSTNIDGMAAHARTVAMRRFSEAFPDLDVTKFETDIYMVETISKFFAFVGMRDKLRAKGFKIISSCEE